MELPDVEADLLDEYLMWLEDGALLPMPRRVVMRVEDYQASTARAATPSNKKGV
jgi:hypothetical protein